MAPFLRIAAAVLVVVSLAAFVVHSPPGWLRNQVDRARAAQDPWAAYLAPTSACKSQADAVSEQRTMICLLDWARAQRGLKPLRVVYPAQPLVDPEGTRDRALRRLLAHPLPQAVRGHLRRRRLPGPRLHRLRREHRVGRRSRRIARAWSSRAGSTRRTTGRTSSAATGRSRGSRFCLSLGSWARRTSRSGSASSACAASEKGMRA